jgi:hypothetical protein
MADTSYTTLGTLLGATVLWNDTPLLDCMTQIFIRARTSLLEVDIAHYE